MSFIVVFQEGRNNRCIMVGVLLLLQVLTVSVHRHVSQCLSNYLSVCLSGRVVHAVKLTNRAESIRTVATYKP